MRIEKINYEDPRNEGRHFTTIFEMWFQENVEPVNKMLSEGPQVYCAAGKELRLTDVWFQGKPGKYATHKALLVGIQEIKPKTREEKALELLEDIINEHDRFPHNLSGDAVQKAKAILEGE